MLATLSKYRINKFEIQKDSRRDTDKYPNTSKIFMNRKINKKIGKGTLKIIIPTTNFDSSDNSYNNDDEPPEPMITPLNYISNKRNKFGWI